MLTTQSGPVVQAISRRAFVRRGTLIMTAAALGGSLADLLAENSTKPSALRFGVLTDLHYADKPTAGTRYYRDSLTKIREGIAKFQDAKTDFVVELGDLIDSAPDVAGEITHLQTIESEYAKFTGDRHYVLGNHCVWTLTKQQFRENCGIKSEHYSFGKGGFHFVVLDACYRSDGVAYGAKNFKWNDAEVPPAEQDWLAEDLKRAVHPTIVFTHQRLDIAKQYAIKSHAAVRMILETSGKVLAVFQGHHHINDRQEINGIHYCTMAALVEGSASAGNAYSVVDLHRDGTVIVNGFRQQKNYTLTPGAPTA